MGKTKTKTKSRSVGDSPKPPITIRSTNPKVIDDNIAKLEKAIKGVDEASEISYDNTGSGLTAENVQSAIDEIVEGLTAPAASSVTYDNTDSGLTATNAQAAIDEISENITLSYLDITIETNTSGLAFIGGDQLVDSINVLLAVNVLNTDSHNNTYISIAKRYSASSTNSTLLVTDGSGAPVASTEIGVRLWYAKL